MFTLKLAGVGCSTYHASPSFTVAERQLGQPTLVDWFQGSHHQRLHVEAGEVLYVLNDQGKTVETVYGPDPVPDPQPEPGPELGTGLC